MWLPTAVYERLPLVWIVIGLMFISATLYVSFEYALSIYYFTLGVLCCASGVVIFMLRQHHRKDGKSTHVDHSHARRPQ